MLPFCGTLLRWEMERHRGDKTVLQPGGHTLPPSRRKQGPGRLPGPGNGCIVAKIKPQLQWLTAQTTCETAARALAWLPGRSTALLYPAVKRADLPINACRALRRVSRLPSARFAQGAIQPGDSRLPLAGVRSGPPSPYLGRGPGTSRGPMSQTQNISPAGSSMMISLRKAQALRSPSGPLMRESSCSMLIAQS